MKICCPHCHRSFALPSKAELKRITEQKVLSLITDSPSGIRWKDLKSKTGFSSRTLSIKLKNLAVAGKITRNIDESVYPPAVFYKPIGKEGAI